MEILEPQENTFTIYSKSGCPNCIKVKQLLKNKQIIFTIVDCDEFILTDKNVFLQKMQEITGKECKYFPMVFDGKQFIGGFLETSNHIEKILDFNLTF
jgi:glutaredoxin